MKLIQFKCLVLITIISLLTGCSLINASTAGTNKPSNRVNSEQPVKAPTSNSKVEISQKVETEETDLNDLSKEEADYEELPNKGPKGKLDDKINQQHFDKIKEGMSLGEVVKIFDDKGMMIGMRNINGRISLIHMWSTIDMKLKIKVIIEDGRVIDKEKSGF